METKDQELEEWSETGEVMELSGERERETICVLMMRED